MKKLLIPLIAIFALTISANAQHKREMKGHHHPKHHEGMVAKQLNFSEIFENFCFRCRHKNHLVFILSNADVFRINRTRHRSIISSANDGAGIAENRQLKTFDG